MTIISIVPPAAEPVSLADAKAFLRIDAPDEDALIADFIRAARRVVEARTGRALITQTLRLKLDAFPDACELSLRRSPVQSVISVTTFDQNGAAMVFDAANYALDGDSHPARILRKPAIPWPIPSAAGGGIVIDFIAGYGPSGSDVPEPLRQAIRILTAHFHEQREAVGEGGGAIPFRVEALLAPFAEVRL
ncbi:MAG: hypothetical protein Tsb0010_03010 [Parvularculaceae bacterium]